MDHQVGMRKYYWELGGALLLYLVVLIATLHFGAGVSSGALQTAVYMSPMAPCLVAIWAIVRQVRRSDEYIRKSTLEDIAVAAAITAGWTLTYGFLENAGLPRLSMFWVWGVMGVAWGMLGALRCVRNR